MMRSCKWCGRMHPVGYECPAKPKQRNDYRRRLTDARAFRNTAEWRRVRAEVNERDAHLCRLCLASGVRSDVGLSAHHIIPLVETLDYAADPEWIITLCHDHHERADHGEYSRDELHLLAIADPNMTRLFEKNGRAGAPPGGRAEFWPDRSDTPTFPLKKNTSAKNEKFKK